MICIVENCSKEGRGKEGYCYMHKTRLKRTGEVGEAESRRTRYEKHGYSEDPLYRVWNSMRQRCYLKTCQNYKRYGAKGTVVCAGWSNSFKSFLEDMGMRPSTDNTRYTVERIDNNGHYSCGHCDDCKKNGWKANCRWATYREQGYNKSTNRHLTYKGKTQTIVQWADEIGMPPNTLFRRLYRGWSPEKTIETPYLGNAEQKKLGEAIVKSR